MAYFINNETKQNLVKSLYKDIDELQNKFNEDENLNNIKMSLIDNKFNEVKTILSPTIRYKKEDGKYYVSLSLAESCSFIKHILIYEILKVIPLFEEDIKNYKELWEEWRNLSDSLKYRTHLTTERYILNNFEKVKI
mgnify:CR=1 FL=1